MTQTRTELPGLTSEQARELFATRGPNEVIATSVGGGLVREALRGLANPLMIVLLVASGVAASVGQLADASIIVLMILLSVVLNGVQTYRSNNAANRLRQRVAVTATALRDGAWVEIPRREIVTGDVVRLSAGDLVPADARLLESRDLHVQQAALTGEPMPAAKEAAVPSTGSAEGANAPNLVFFGTSVVSGTGTAVITATGLATMFGDIIAQLARRPPQTEFERGLGQFGALITKTVLVLVVFIVLVSIVLHRDPLESLLFAVALAVGLVPEFLPMITSVTLAAGAVRMSRAHVIVKHLSAIHNFGSIDVLCSDKTGTLTKGEMTVAGSFDALGRASPRTLDLARLNAHFETGIRSPLDAAIVAGSATSPDDCEKLDEIPFDFERRRQTIVLRRGSDRLFITKGAAESVLQCCTTYEDGADRPPVDDAFRARFDESLRAFGADGLRVIAVGVRSAEAKAAFTAADENALSLVGFLTFSDPPLEDAAAAVRALRDAGVEMKILTGDDDLVTRHVCSMTGIDASQAVSGADVERLTDAALGQVAERTNVFARVSPIQKNRIILALKSRGHVVGYLGDGINDAPSLHSADVGISVASAVDAAKEAADIILLQPGLDVLHMGIIEGRRAFGNVMKYLLMGTSSNFGNMLSMACASVVLPFLPLLPTQILLNSFLYDCAQVAIPTDQVDAEYLQKPHRWDMKALRRFMITIGPISSLFDFLTFAVLLLVFHAGEPLFHTGWFEESLVTQVLVLFVIRTTRSPIRSRPSAALVVTALSALAIGAALPITPLAGLLGFVPLPLPYMGFLIAATATYLLLVEAAKHRLLAWTRA